MAAGEREKIVFLSKDKEFIAHSTSFINARSMTPNSGKHANGNTPNYHDETSPVQLRHKHETPTDALKRKEERKKVVSSPILNKSGKHIDKLQEYIDSSDYRELGLKKLKSGSFESIARWEKENGFLYAVIEDESDWLTRLFPEDPVSPEYFFEKLEDGVILCKLSELCQKYADEFAANSNRKVMSFPIYIHPRKRCQGRLGKFMRRENVELFLKWCRHHNIHESLLFESNDVVEKTEEKGLRENAREIVLCLMEVARLGVKWGVAVPRLIELEREIELEEQMENSSMDGSISPVSIDSAVDEFNFHSDRERLDSSNQDGEYFDEQSCWNMKNEKNTNYKEKEKNIFISEKYLIDHTFKIRGKTEEADLGAISCLYQSITREINIDDQPETSNVASVPEHITKTQFSEYDEADFPKAAPHIERLAEMSAYQSPRRRISGSEENLSNKYRRRKTSTGSRANSIDHDCTKRERKKSSGVKTELHQKVTRIIESYNIEKFLRLREGKYVILGKVMFVRTQELCGDFYKLSRTELLNDHCIVRIGGGWDTLEHYLITHSIPGKVPPDTYDLKDNETRNESPPLPSATKKTRRKSGTLLRQRNTYLTKSTPNLLNISNSPVTSGGELSDRETRSRSPSPSQIRDPIYRTQLKQKRDERKISQAILRVQADVQSSGNLKKAASLDWTHLHNKEENLRTLKALQTIPKKKLNLVRKMADIVLDPMPTENNNNILDVDVSDLPEIHDLPPTPVAKTADLSDANNSSTNLHVEHTETVVDKDGSTKEVVTTSKTVKKGQKTKTTTTKVITKTSTSKTPKSTSDLKTTTASKKPTAAKVNGSVKPTNSSTTTTISKPKTTSSATKTAPTVKTVAKKTVPGISANTKSEDKAFVVKKSEKPISKSAATKSSGVLKSKSTSADKTAPPKTASGAKSAVKSTTASSVTAPKPSTKSTAPPAAVKSSSTKLPPKTSSLPSKQASSTLSSTAKPKTTTLKSASKPDDKKPTKPTAMKPATSKPASSTNKPITSSANSAKTIRPITATKVKPTSSVTAPKAKVAESKNAKPLKKTTQIKAKDKVASKQSSDAEKNIVIIPTPAATESENAQGENATYDEEEKEEVPTSSTEVGEEASLPELQQESSSSPIATEKCSPPENQQSESEFTNVLENEVVTAVSMQQQETDPSDIFEQQTETTEEHHSFETKLSNVEFDLYCVTPLDKGQVYSDTENADSPITSPLKSSVTSKDLEFFEGEGNDRDEEEDSTSLSDVATCGTDRPSSQYLSPTDETKDGHDEQDEGGRIGRISFANNDELILDDNAEPNYDKLTQEVEVEPEEETTIDADEDDKVDVTDETNEQHNLGEHDKDAGTHTVEDGEENDVDELLLDEASETTNVERENEHLVQAWQNSKDTAESFSESTSEFILDDNTEDTEGSQNNLMDDEQKVLFEKQPTSQIREDHKVLCEQDSMLVNFGSTSSFSSSGRMSIHDFEAEHHDLSPTEEDKDKEAENVFEKKNQGHIEQNESVEEVVGEQLEELDPEEPYLAAATENGSEYDNAVDTDGSDDTDELVTSNPAELSEHYEIEYHEDTTVVSHTAEFDTHAPSNGKILMGEFGTAHNDSVDDAEDRDADSDSAISEEQDSPNHRVVIKQDELLYYRDDVTKEETTALNASPSGHCPTPIPGNDFSNQDQIMF